MCFFFYFALIFLQTTKITEVIIFSNTIFCELLQFQHLIFVFLVTAIWYSFEKNPLFDF